MIKPFVACRRAFIGLLAVTAVSAGAVYAAGKAQSDEPKPVDPKLVKEITQKLQQSRADLEISRLTRSPIKGLYQAQITNGPLVYVTEDGQYLIDGNLYQLAPGRLVNVTEQGRAGERLDALAKIDKEDMIVFSPKGKPKTHITVFTDVDCGYCRMLHQEVPQLNEMGIEVRYMAFPRAGVNSGAFNKLATAWCADDPQQALTKLKNGENVANNVCEDNPIAEQYHLGQSLGVTATPALVLESGELQLGYMKAPQLADRLGVKP